MPACPALPCQGKAPFHQHQGPLAEVKAFSNSIPGCSRARFRSWAAQRQPVWIKLLPAGDTLFGVGGAGWRHRRPPSGGTGFFELFCNSELPLFSQSEAVLCHTAAQKRFLKAAKVINTNCMPKLCRFILAANLCGI